MRGTTTSVFSETDDYQAALRHDGGFNLVVTGHGEFRAELTRLELPRTYLMAGTESLARIAFISLPTNVVGVALPTRNGGLLISGGIASSVDEIVTHGPGQRTHEATDGPCHWRTIRLHSRDLLKYGRAMIGRAFDIPLGTCRWRPKREALRRLNRLHDDATRMSKAQPRMLAAAGATHGLEQELIAVLIDCMRGKATDEDTAARRRQAEVMCRFEDLLSNFSDRAPSITDVCAALEVPDRTLRAYCGMHLGMAPHRYLRLRQMQLARRALRGADPAATRISDVAHRYGFDGLGRFAASYREQFGELPSDTVRRHVP